MNPPGRLPAKTIRISSSKKRDSVKRPNLSTKWPYILISGFSEMAKIINQIQINSSDWFKIHYLVDFDF